MTVAFEQGSVEVSAGGSTAVGYTVTNEALVPRRFDFYAEGDKGLESEWLQLDAPGVVEARRRAHGVLWIRLPAGVAPGEYRLHLVAIHPVTRHRSVAECVVSVTDESAGKCVMFPEEPSFQLDSDGLTTTVTVANCGGLDLNVTLRFRHEAGWHFDVEREVALETGFGPVTVTVPLDPSGDSGTELQDRISVEAESHGQVLASETGVVTPPAPRPHRWPRNRGRAAAGVVLVLGFAMSVWGDEVINALVEEQPNASAELVVDVQEVDFGSVEQGDSEAREVVARNAGGGSVAIGEVTVSGDASAFTVEEDGCSQAALASEESCQVTVVFAPSEAGQYRAHLDVGHEGGPTSVELSGQSVPAGEPDLVISDFRTTDSATFEEHPENNEEMIRVPVRGVVRNQGSAAADESKISAHYRTDEREPVVAFTADGEAFDPIWYPKAAPLGPGDEVHVDGDLWFLVSHTSEELPVWTIADSCSGEEFAEQDCRISEENEDNNKSAEIEISMPPPVVF